jgi:hypothetical protein
MKTTPPSTIPHQAAPMGEGKDDRLLRLFAQLAGAVMDRGLAHARQDDPHAYGQAVKWAQAGGGKFQLRIDLDPAALNVTTRGLLVDDDGEALVQVFAIAGALGDGDAPKTH